MPGKLRARKDFDWALARPIDQSWVQAGLERMNTLCEWPKCSRPATVAFESIRTAAYLCNECATRLESRPALCARLDDSLYETFREGFDFITQVEMTGGELLEQLDGYKDNARSAIERAERAAARDAKLRIKEMLRTLRAEGLVVNLPGMPDRELLEARGFAVQESGVLIAPLLGQGAVTHYAVTPVSVTAEMRDNMTSPDQEVHPEK